MALAALAMSDCDPMSYEYHSYIDLNKIVDEQARRIGLMVDAATLDRLAPTLNMFGWYKREETADKNGFDRDMGFECVRCGAMTDDYMYAPDDIGHITRFNYCPCCGAKVVIV